MAAANGSVRSFGIMNTVSRTKELEQSLRRSENQLRLFQRISRFMARETDLEEALQEIVSLVAEHLEADSCLLYLLSGNELVLCAANTPHASTVGRVRLKFDEGLTGWVARERRILAISREAFRDSRFKFFRDMPEDTYEAFLSVPVIARNRIAGAINVQHRQPHPHTGAEMELLSTVGEQVGCLLMLARAEPYFSEETDYADFLLPAGSAPREN